MGLTPTFRTNGDTKAAALAWAQDPLNIVTERILEWPVEVRTAHVTPVLSQDDIQSRVATHDLSQPHDLGALVAEVVDLLERGGLHSTHPRYFGLFVPGVRRAGVIADALAALYNPQIAAWWHAPAANEIERHTLAYLSRQIGFTSSDATATFTTGGSEANQTGVLLALASAFPGYQRDGLVGLTGRPLLYASDQAHDSFVKVARMTGIGERALRRVRSDARQRLDVDDLRRLVARDRSGGKVPFCVIGTAGTTATGAIDPLPVIADLCRTEGLWFHVDAAWGGLALLSDQLRPHVAGIERANSVTWDAHKTLPIPMGAGMFFCRAHPIVRSFFSVNTGYVPEALAGREDAYQHSIQWSRRFIGLKVFLTLAELGSEGIARMIEHQAAMACLLRERLVESGWRLMNDTPLPLVCFTRDSLSPEATADLPRRVAADGVAWISAIRLVGGECWLRACITHHQTDPSDIDALVAGLDDAAAGFLIGP
jgi:glutamate/tyrosine decarboxylase-like PLP-dependent enzyme